MPDMISKDLGPVSGYAIAVAHGYTGTEAQWIEEVLKGTQNAQTATQKAAEAAQSANTASQSATSALNSATTATQKASEAASSATAASGSATNAANSATTATQQATAASGSATAAANSASEAQEVLDSIPSDYTTLSNDVSDLKSSFELASDETTLQGALTTGQVVRLNDAGTKASMTSSASWTFYTLNVVPGDILIIQTVLYGTTYKGVFFVDNEINSNLVGDPFGVATASVATPMTFITKVPSGAYIAYINCRATYTAVVSKIPKQKEIKKFKILSSNLGKFEHGDGTTTPSEYLAEWRSTLNTADYDLMACCEAVEQYTDDISTINALFNGGSVIESYSANYNSLLLYFLASRIGFITQTATVNLTNTDGEITTDKYKVHRSYLPSIDTWIYIVHLVPSTAYDLRALQFADLISDAADKQNVIIAGDFNAQSASEYDTFLENGYSIANGDFYGTYLTLRDELPTDNIIVKGKLIIDSVTVYSADNLNTDHDLIAASITIKE